MMLSACDGSYINSSMAAVYDRVAEQYRTYRRYEASETETETRVVAALVTVAGRLGDEERAVLAQADSRNGDPDDDDEATRIVREHGFSPDRLVALRGLARSRGVELEAVLRATLRGELRDIVKLPVAPVP